MVTFEDLKPTLMEEQRAAQEWAKDALAWGDAAAHWEAAVTKTPRLCEVRARWASAAMSWVFAANAWVPRSGESWIPGNHAWTSASYHWAVVSHRWALASLKWALAAQSYPACAGESLPSAASARDWASASVAWAEPQSIWEAPLVEWAMVAKLFAVAGERAAELAAWARAGPVVKMLPHPPAPTKPSVTEHHAENHAARDGAADLAARARAGPVVKTPHPPSPTMPSVAEHHAEVVDSAMEHHAARDGAADVASARAGSVAPHPPSPVTSSVAVAESGKATQETAREDTAHGMASDEPLRIEKKALLQDHGRGDATGTSVNLSLAEDRAAGKVFDLENTEEFPHILPADPTRRTAPKPGREQQLQLRRQGIARTKMRSRRRLCSPAVTALDDDVLREILLRLPPHPSALLRASLVCKRWCGIVSDPKFFRRFRHHHHRNPPPLIGFFGRCDNLHFLPTLDPPNRVPAERFCFHRRLNFHLSLSLGSRHGLVLIPNRRLLEVLVCDPVTGDQHCIACPTAFGLGKPRFSGAVLRASGDHFQVVLVVAFLDNDRSEKLIASIYSSKSGLWGGLVSMKLPYHGSERGTATRVSVDDDAVLAGGCLYWELFDDSGGVVEFNMEQQTLDVLRVPVHMHGQGNSFKIMRAEGGGLGFLFICDYTVQLWKRTRHSAGATSWVLERTVELDQLLSFKTQRWPPVILGFAEESNMVFLWTTVGLFLICLETWEFQKLIDANSAHDYFAFESVSIAVRDSRNKNFKEKKKSKGKDNDPLFKEISKDDYFVKNIEFVTWLKEEKGKDFWDLSSESARDIFLKFVKQWNKGKLPSKYYEGINIRPRAAYHWNFKA